MISRIVLPDHTKKHQWYGCHPDLPDARDIHYHTHKAAALPSKFSLVSGFPYAPWNQYQIGSCGSNAFDSLVTFDQKKQGLSIFSVSRLFIYYNTRVLEGTPGQDSGVQIRDVFKAYNQFGCAPEADWGYAPSKVLVKPPDQAYTDATKDKPLAYARVSQNLNAIKQALYNGYPIEIGFTVYESFESDQVARTGIVPMPSSADQVVGGHAVVICGWDDSTRLFLVRNSWGTDWGQKGYFQIPYDYFCDPDLASDFWVLTQITEQAVMVKQKIKKEDYSENLCFVFVF